MLHVSIDVWAPSHDVFGSVNKRNTRIQCDSGAFCSCVSLQFYNKFKNKPSVDPSSSVGNLKAANNVPLDVGLVGTVDLDVVICGISIPVKFYVVRNLSQNCIVGGPFLEECGANINYVNKTLSLYENIITVRYLTTWSLIKHFV